MGIERTYYCDGPGCGDGNEGGNPCSVRTATPPPHIPSGYIETRQTDDMNETRMYFCSWSCLMKYSAAQPIPTTIEWDGLDRRDD
jgi:hypothetical protein